MTSLLLLLIACLMEGAALMIVLGGFGLVWAIPVAPGILLPYGLVAALGLFLFASWRS